MAAPFLSEWWAWWWGRLRLPRSLSGHMLRAMMITGALMVGVKVASLAKELVVARMFGTSDARDAFLIAFALPAFAITVIAQSFSAAFLPTYVTVNQRDGAAAAQRLLSTMMGVALGFLAFASIGLAVLSPWLLRVLAWDFSAEKFRLTQQLFFVLLPILLVQGVITFAGAVLNAGRKFALAALSPLCMPVLTLGALIFFVESWGIFALAAGTVLGFALEAVILVVALRRRQISLWPRWHGLSADARIVVGQYAPMVAGACLHGLTVLVDQAMAASLGPSSVSILDYGTKIVTPLLGVTAGALGTVALPYFSQMIANDDWPALRHTLCRWSLLILVTTIPVTAGMIVISEPLVRVLFQGHAFTAADTAIVAQAQALYLLQIPPYLLGILIVRLISAVRANHILMWGAVISLALNIGLNLWFMRVFGVVGIALSTAVVYLASCVFLGTMLMRQLKRSERGGQSR